MNLLKKKCGELSRLASVNDKGTIRDDENADTSILSIETAQLFSV